MDRIFAYLVRFAVIVFGFFVAVFAASLFVHALTLPAFGISTDEEAWIAMGGLFVSVPFVALFIGYYAFFPAAVAITLSELAAWRGFLFHAFAGAAVGIVTNILFRTQQTYLDPERYAAPGIQVDPGSASGEALLVIAATGMVAGIAYWLVAGRTAGSWWAVDSD